MPDFEDEKKPKPKVNPERLAELEEELLEKVEKRAELRKLEEQANAELEEKPVKSGSIEQTFLFVAAALVLFALPFLHVLFAIVLALFTIIISLVAGLTSPRHPYSPMLNLFVSLIGLVLFEYAAIISHAESGSLFLFYEFVAFIFLIATFFSVRTYQKRREGTIN